MLRLSPAFVVVVAIDWYMTKHDPYAKWTVNVDDFHHAGSDALLGLHDISCVAALESRLQHLHRQLSMLLLQLMLALSMPLQFLKLIMLQFMSTPMSMLKIMLQLIAAAGCC